MIAQSLLTLLLLLGALVSSAAPSATQPAPQPWRVVGKLDYKPIAECSGIVASRAHPGVFWVHNDSGNPAVLYAVKRDGSLIGEFPVAAPNHDWEDIAIDDEGRMYIGDIGNNGGRRSEVVVHRVNEPDPAKSKDIVRVKVDRKWVLTFPEQPFDCEALFIHRGHGYVISKLYFGGQAGLYRFPLDETDKPLPLERIASIPVRTPVTAADLSADGRRLAVLSVAGVSVFQIGGDVSSVEKASASFIPYLHATMEACCFADAGLLVATEPREILLFDIDPKKPAAE